MFDHIKNHDSLSEDKFGFQSGDCPVKQWVEIYMII